MNSKERVLAAIARQEPDRVPIDYSCNAGIDRRLKAHFGLGEKDSEGLRKALHVDFRGAGPKYTGPKLHADRPGVQIDLWGIHRRWIEHPTGGYWDYCDFPLKDATLEDVEKWPMPSPEHYDYSGVAEQCRQQQEYCISTGGAGTGDIINKSGMLFTMEETLVRLMTDDPALLRFTDRRLAIDLEIIRRTLEAARGGIDLLQLGEDLGTQIGPMISLDFFRKIIRPRHQKFVDLAKSFHIPVMIHSCGSSSWAFNDFVEMGIGMVDTLQPEAEDMAPAYLKKTYGDRLAFHGCISTAGPVATGAVEDVVRNVRETLEIMKPGGGYVLAPTHALQDNSPTENVVAMYRTAMEFGQYA